MAAARSSAAIDSTGKYDGTSATSQATSIADSTTSTRPAPVPRPTSGAYSDAAAPARIVTASWNAGFGNQTIADSATTAMMTPLVRRTMCVLDRFRPAAASLGADRFRRGGDAPVPALALLIGQHRLQQMAAAEIRPQRVGHVDFGVRDLPQQVVA